MKSTFGSALLGIVATALACILLSGPKSIVGQSRIGQGAAQEGVQHPAAAQRMPANSSMQASVEPADLAKELTVSNKPIIVCVGTRVLYEGAHIPGSAYHGAASKEDGLKDLKDWAKDVPKDSNIVLYCGCCPLTRCPNIHPALQALEEMGFTKVRMLRLPTDFNTDWIEKGYPVEKGK